MHFHSKPANKQELPYYPFTPDPTLELPKEPRPTKEQPYFWIGIILGIIGVGFIVSRAKVNALLNEVNDMENQTGKKF